MLFLHVHLNIYCYKLDNIYKRKGPTDASPHEEACLLVVKREPQGTSNDCKDDDKAKDSKNSVMRPKRMNLGTRIALKRKVPSSKKTLVLETEDQRVERLVREYSASTDSVRMDWKKMLIQPVLHSSEHAFLFKLMQSVRVAIQKGKLELMFELKRMPTEEEIIKRVGIEYLIKGIKKLGEQGKPVYSLNKRHNATQEELINGIADVDGVEGDKRRQSALLRLALDDVLDSLKPKEGLVIRQRYRLDGKGDRTLREIAGNLNISREMVRKHEMKALMKLKHPARSARLSAPVYLLIN